MRSHILVFEDKLVNCVHVWLCDLCNKIFVLFSKRIMRASVSRVFGAEMFYITLKASSNCFYESHVWCGGPRGSIFCFSGFWSIGVQNARDQDGLQRCASRFGIRKFRRQLRVGKSLVIYTNMRSFSLGFLFMSVFSYYLSFGLLF